eukprot:TRINITY_DN3498_c0_g1_i1.p1 TRINITY_DN3498_c0_g1~~TRINITY_DN3498_c0_g1_i1.p1  ORF type:complete len:257 (-),score=138.38 TRINITY_DN3498_c0_g1_i1:67-837(-)
MAAADNDYKQQLAELTAQSIDEQSKAFLRAFVLEFQGKFEEVLELSNDFIKFVPKGSDCQELDEAQAHLFLERKFAAMTVRELRDAVDSIDLDKNHKMSFIEFLLFHYRKTLAELFSPVLGASPELLAALDQAVTQYQGVLAQRRAREDKIEELKAASELGGVKGARAKAELAQLLSQDQLDSNRAEIQAAYKKKLAQRAVDEDSTGAKARQAALEAEQKRLEEERLKKEAEERAKKEESRNRLAARAALFENRNN